MSGRLPRIERRVEHDKVDEPVETAQGAEFGPSLCQKGSMAPKGPTLGAGPGSRGLSVLRTIVSLFGSHYPCMQHVIAYMYACTLCPCLGPSHSRIAGITLVLYQHLCFPAALGNITASPPEHPNHIPLARFKPRQLKVASRTSVSSLVPCLTFPPLPKAAHQGYGLYLLVPTSGGKTHVKRRTRQPFVVLARASASPETVKAVSINGCSVSATNTS